MNRIGQFIIYIIVVSTIVWVLPLPQWAGILLCFFMGWNADTIMEYVKVYAARATVAINRWAKK